MTTTVKNLVPPKAAENVQTTQYTATNCTAIIDKFTATNTSGANATLSINLVPGGGSAGSSNLVLSAKTLAPNETYTCPEVVGHVLPNGAFISTIAGATGAITIDVSGREIT